MQIAQARIKHLWPYAVRSVLLFVAMVGVQVAWNEFLSWAVGPDRSVSQAIEIAIWLLWAVPVLIPVWVLWNVGRGPTRIFDTGTGIRLEDFDGTNQEIAWCTIQAVSRSKAGEWVLTCEDQSRARIWPKAYSTNERQHLEKLFQSRFMESRGTTA
jgi:hypothetical protein